VTPRYDEVTMAVRLQTRRSDVDAYHRMAAAGILRREGRAELIEGSSSRRRRSVAATSARSITSTAAWSKAAGTAQSSGSTARFV
jgi:hypothetical protein